MMEKNIYDSLNEEQKKAVEAIDGPLLILAGPGTGKTQLLSIRAANIMDKKKINGEHILILTFTNSAAKAVKERLAEIIGYKGYEIIAETFHSFANSIILDSEEATEYLKTRIQMADIERLKAIEYILDNLKDAKELKPFGNPYFYRNEIEKKISELKNEGISPNEFIESLDKLDLESSGLKEKYLIRLKEFALVYKIYEEIKKGRDKNIFDDRGRYDYDDMILIAKEALAKEKDLKKAYQEKYKYIMVDEFQDSNGAQLKLLFELIDSASPNICCVGDDDQSIYRFQGASRVNFKIFQGRFPNLKTVKLKINYRSPKEILDISSMIIQEIPLKERLDKEKALIPATSKKNNIIEVLTFSNEDEEIVYIVKRIKELKKDIENADNLTEEERKRPYNNIAILLRKRVFILKLIDAFLRSGIPYTTDGKEDISREKRVRQLIDALKLAKPSQYVQEKDMLLYRMLTSDYFEIPHSDILKFMDYVNKKRKIRSDKETSANVRSLLTEFMSEFPVNIEHKPSVDDTKKLKIVKEVDFKKENDLHIASWAVARLLRDSDARPVHDVLMQFIDDASFYKFIMREFEDKKLLRIRDVRAMSSFVNMIKNLSMSNPRLTVSGYMADLSLYERHNMPVTGELVTYAQDGVNVITAHASKGLEFHTVIIPFCLHDKSWPLKRMTDRIPLGASIIKIEEKTRDKHEEDMLNLFDETRLFYVASSRAKTNLIFTASPSLDAISSSFLGYVGVIPKENRESEESVIHEFFRITEKEDLFTDSKSILKNILKDLALTPTKLNTFLQCRRKFLYNSVLLLPGRKKQSLVFGNCVHKALEETYKIYKREKVFPDFDYFKNIFLRELTYQGIDNAIRNGCEGKLPLLENWFKLTKEKPIIPLDLEKNKTITLKGGIKFAGKFDKIEFEDEARKFIRVIDYKTGLPDDHIKNLNNISSIKDDKCDGYLRQLVAYKMLYERDAYEKSLYKVSHGILVFVESVKETSKRYDLVKGEYVNKKVEISDDMVRDLEELINIVWDGINKVEFDKLPEIDKDVCGSRNFHKCDFYSMCWED